MTRVTGEEKFLSAVMALLVPLAYRVRADQQKKNPGPRGPGLSVLAEVVTC